MRRMTYSPITGARRPVAVLCAETAPGDHSGQTNAAGAQPSAVGRMTKIGPLPSPSDGVP